MSRTEHGLPKWAPTYFAVWAAIGVIILVLAAGWAFGRIAGALAPFILAFLIVFLLQGPVRALLRRGLSRPLAVTICFVFGIAILGVLITFIIPPMTREVVSFVNAIPDYLTIGRDFLLDMQAQLGEIVFPTWVRDAVDNVSASLGRIFVSVGDILARGLVSAGSGIATVIFDLVMGGVVAFWVLKDLPKIRREMRTLAGDKYEDDLENLVGTVGRVVGGYLRGQTIASLFTGALAAVGLAVIGIPYALVLGILTFILNYVPYVGPFVAGAVAAVVGLFVGPLQALLAIAIVVAAQQLTDIFITPRVMSEQVDLHPILVIFSLLVGGSLFGFWGMIFAIPFAATAKGLFVYYWEQRMDRPLATEDGALFKTPVACDDAEGEPSGDDTAATAGCDTDTKGSE